MLSYLKFNATLFILGISLALDYTLDDAKHKAILMSVNNSPFSIDSIHSNWSFLYLCFTTRSHTFVETDHEIIPMVILLPSAESFKNGCCQYVHEVLFNRLFKLAQKKVWLGELTVPP